MSLPTLPTLPGNPSVSPDALVGRLFQRLSIMYGKHWSELWAGIPLDAVKAEWARTLTGVEPESMRLALDSMLTAGKPFPPTLPEFVSLCRQFRRQGPHRLALAEPRGEMPQKVRDALAKLRGGK